MKKTFYSHLVSVKIVQEELDSSDLTKSQKEELMEQVHASIHLTVMDVILSELSDVDKKQFIDLVNSQDHESLWNHLLGNVQGIEQKIRNTVSHLLEEFRKDVQLASQKHQK